MPKKKGSTLDIGEKSKKPLALNLSEIIGKDVSEIAKLLDCSTQAVNQYKQGTSTPQIDKLIKIAKHYNVSVDWLLGLTHAQTTNPEIKAICNYTGLSEKAIMMFQKVTKYDDEKEISHFFESSIGEFFLKSIIDFCDDVKNDGEFRKYLATNSDEPFLDEVVDDLEITKVKSYEIIAFRISQLLQQYFNERAKELYKPILEYEKQRNKELFDEIEKIDKMLGIDTKEQTNGNDK